MTHPKSMSLMRFTNKEASIKVHMHCISAIGVSNGDDRAKAQQWIPEIAWLLTSNSDMYFLSSFTSREVIALGVTPEIPENSLPAHSCFLPCHRSISGRRIHGFFRSAPASSQSGGDMVARRRNLLATVGHRVRLAAKSHVSRRRRGTVVSGGFRCICDP